MVTMMFSDLHRCCFNNSLQREAQQKNILMIINYSHQIWIQTFPGSPFDWHVVNRDDREENIKFFNWSAEEGWFKLLKKTKAEIYRSKKQRGERITEKAERQLKFSFSRWGTRSVTDLIQFELLAC